MVVVVATGDRFFGASLFGSKDRVELDLQSSIPYEYCEFRSLRIASFYYVGIELI